MMASYHYIFFFSLEKLRLLGILYIIYTYYIFTYIFPCCHLAQCTEMVVQFILKYSDTCFLVLKHVEGRVRDVPSVNNGVVL